MKPLIKIFFIAIISLTVIRTANAQTKKQIKQAEKEAAVKKLIDSQNFVFQANYMYPLGGGQTYLNPPYYDLTVGKDSLAAFLPYFGVAYFGVGYNNNNDDGVKFTSTKFSYDKKVKEKGNWVIIIKPQDIRNTNQLILSIAQNGNADLSILSVNRQQIRFNGIIKEKPKTKK